MTSDLETPENPDSSLPQLDEELQSRVEDIDGSFVEGLEPDDRLQSGVPEKQRATDLDFIQMSGLTKPLPQAKPGDLPGYRAESVEAVEPVDFYEQGVSDVDAEIARPVLEDADVTQGERISPAEGPRPEDEADVAEVSPDLECAPVGDAEPLDAVELVGFFEQGVSDMDTEIAQPLCEDADVPAEHDDFAAALELLRCQEQDLSTAHVNEAGKEAEEGEPGAEAPAGPHEQPIVVDPPSLVDLEGVLHESDEGEQAGARREQAGVSQEGPDAVEAAFSDLEPEGGLVTGEDACFPPAAGVFDEDAASGQGTAISGEEADAVAPEGVALTEELLVPSESLVEAEQLLEALETQPREPADDEVEWTDTALPDPTRAVFEAEAEQESDEIDQAAYREPAVRHARRRSQRSRARQRVMRWGIRLCILAILAAAVSLAYVWLWPRMITPEGILAKAHELVAQGQYAQASQAFSDFIRRHPDHASRADLQFLAGHCLQMASTGSFDERQPSLVRALDLYGGFIEAYPAHAKVPRARVLMGQICFELGRYEEAIDLLRDPRLPIKDPDAALPALRMLGRAHAQLGDYDAAESVYLQAASLSGNYSPDLDYVALAELFKLRADRAQTPGEREGFLNAAIEHWTHSVRVPGIDPKSKEKIEWIMTQLGGEAPATGTPQGPAAAAPSAPPAEVVVPDASALPRAAQGSPLPLPAQSQKETKPPTPRSADAGS